MCLLFLFFAILQWQVLPAIYWIIIMRVDHSSLVFNIRGKAFNPSSSKMSTVGFLYLFCIKLRSFPSFSNLLRVVIMNDCWFLSNAFSASCNMIMWFFFLSLLMWWIALIDYLLGKNFPSHLYLLLGMMLNSIYIEKDESF